jgi:membrane protein YdbS with pleckstrin-like domain
MEYVQSFLMLASMLIGLLYSTTRPSHLAFVIAIAGVALWYFSAQRQLWRSILLAIVFVFTCMSPTDIFPAFIRFHIFVPYTIKAVPCIVLRFVILYRLMTTKKEMCIPAQFLAA